MTDEEVGEAWANNDKRVCVHAEIVEQLIHKLVEERARLYVAKGWTVTRLDKHESMIANALRDFHIDPATWPEDTK